MSENILEFIVPEGTKPIRADKFISRQLEDYSRSQIEKSFENQEVTVNAAPVAKRHMVTDKDKIVIKLPSQKETQLIPKEADLDILYEDKDIIVINKAAGVVVHPGTGTGDDTLVHRLLFHTDGGLSTAAGELRPGVVHRLDKETSGAIVFAKSDKAYFKLVKFFSRREITKEYIAIVQGMPTLLSGSIKSPIDRHPVNRVKMCVSEKGRDAHTDWSIEKNLGGKYTLLRCYLHSGRTHQIRVHLSSIKHTIYGDKLYGFQRQFHEVPAPRVLLHAEYLSFMHPVTGEKIECRAKIPADLTLCMDQLLKQSRS